MKHNNKFEHLSQYDSDGSWAISYGDMLTLIAAFFIIFFAADKFQKNKNNQLPVISLSDSIKSSSDNQNVIFQYWFDPQVQKQLNAKIENKEGKLIIEFLGVSFFPSGKVDLKNEAKKKLDHFFSLYEPIMGKYNILITSFSDPRPLKKETRKKYKNNLYLSTLRSTTIMDYLYHKGVPFKNMKIQGFGELSLKYENLSHLDIASDFLRQPASEQKRKLDDYARTALIIIEPKEGAL